MSDVASNEFVASVVDALRNILGSETEPERLGLTGDIVNGWRGFLARYSNEKMADFVGTVARDNRISLNAFETNQGLTPIERAKAAAEMVLGTVDGFYRRTLTRPN